MEIYRGIPIRDDVRREVWEVQHRSRREDRKKGKASAKKQGGTEQHLKRYMTCLAKV